MKEIEVEMNQREIRREKEQPWSIEGFVVSFAERVEGKACATWLDRYTLSLRAQRMFEEER